MSADVGDVRGLWRRTIYRRGNEAPDASTDVHWMQGPRFFADIRQPVERASFVRVGCLRDLESEHLAWLALLSPENWNSRGTWHGGGAPST